MEPLLTVRRVMRQQLATLHKLLLNAVRVDPVCRRFMTVPGVGPIVALTYRASVDQPHRFIHSRAVGAHVGLTPKRHQSGEIDYDGGVSKCGDSMLRAMLYEAAQSMLTHSKKWSWLKAWGMRVAQRRGMGRAIVAVARRLAVILHRMWVDGTDFRWRNGSTAVVQVAYGTSYLTRSTVLPRQEDVLTGTMGGASSQRQQILPLSAARKLERLNRSALLTPS